MLLYHICNKLNYAWESITGVRNAYRKLRMNKDGHLVDDNRYYIRPRGVEVYATHLYVYNRQPATEDQGEVFMKKGRCEFGVDLNVYDVQPSPIAGEMLEMLRLQLARINSESFVFS